jgi:hypothetical protein
MAPSNRDKRSSGTHVSDIDQLQSQSPLDGIDLLEIGPEDGSEDLLDFENGTKLQAVIKVVGVGGGGGNALNTMIASGLGGVETAQLDELRLRVAPPPGPQGRAQ